jgi:hypothetical protein
LSPRALSIGITVSVSADGESLWLNGIKQNALFLAKLLQGSPLRHRVVLLNTSGATAPDKLPWSVESFPTIPMGEGDHDLDLVFELGAQVSASQTDALKRRGARLISYCCGAEYVQNIEAMIFRRRLWDHLFINERYDEVWVIPQVAETSLWFFQTFRRRPARIAPFVWDPMCLDAITADYPDLGAYRPQGEAKRLAVFEPNIDVLKFCLYPLLIAERAYREAPDKIAFLHVTNADRLVYDDTEFAALARQLDIVNAQKASFVGRFETPRFLAEHTDVVLSHQWSNGLNYAYLEACWQGYPLVHNAHLCPELGYYYPANDIDEGARQLLRVLETHDLDWEGYRLRQRALIGRFLSTNAQLAADYDQMMFELLARDPAP